MKAKVIISLDGSVTTFNTKGIRMPSLTGNLDVLHIIVDNYKKAFCKVDENVRIVNPDIVIRNDSNQQELLIPIEMLENWVRFIKRPKSIRKGVNLAV